MTAPPRWRWPLLLALLTSAAGLALYGDKRPAGLAQPVQDGAPGRSPANAGTRPRPTDPARTATASVEAPVATQTPHALIDRADLLAGRLAAPNRLAGAVSGDTSGNASVRSPSFHPRSNPFAVTREAPPPALAPTPVIAPTPIELPPPPPWVYQGKQLTGSRWEVFLGLGEQTYIVQEGSTVDRHYRIDRIAPPTLTLTDLAQARTYSIAIGEAP